MIIVLDTNVLVSALLNPHGRPADVLRHLRVGVLRLAYDDRIVAEYRQVLLRPRFPFALAEVEALLAFVTGDGLAVTPALLATVLPDPSDLPFLEVATATGATLVTGNKRHFPARAAGAVPVKSPSELLLSLASRR